MTRRTILGNFLSAVMLAGSVAHGQKRAEIRDRQGRLIGTIVRRRDGVREARDRQWRLLGTYSPKTNETRDRLGRLLTKGDTLTSLLFSENSKR